MTATTAAGIPSDARVTLPRLIRSEWIKITSLRSTFWTSGIILVLWLAVALLFATTAGLPSYGPDGIPIEPAPASERMQQEITVMPMTIGVVFGVLIAGIQGVLVISGEYSTGMIRSSIAAAPGRLSMYAAKGVVLFVWMFLLGAVSALGSYALSIPFLAPDGLLAPLGGDLLLIVLGAATYLGLVSLVGLGIGTFVRSGAGGIAIIVGLLLVLPMVVNILSIWIEWVRDVVPYLLDQAGTAMTTLPGSEVMGAQELSPGIAALVAAAWAAMALILGAIALTRRDA